MAFALNLRSDLKGLTTSQLAQSLNAQLSYLEEMERQTGVKLRYVARGPIRHPFIYKFLSVALLTNRNGMSLSTPALFGWFKYDKLQLAMCEIYDLTDELERRRGELVAS